METASTDSLMEDVFRELRKTNPNVFLGLPPLEFLQRRKAERLTHERDQLIRCQDAEDREFQRLKAAALSQIRRTQK